MPSAGGELSRHSLTLMVVPQILINSVMYDFMFFSVLYQGKFI